MAFISLRPPPPIGIREPLSVIFAYPNQNAPGSNRRRSRVN